MQRQIHSGELPSSVAMAAESCHSRSFSWLVKSCVPADPGRHISVPVPISSSSAAAGVSEPAAHIDALPEDLLLECLARVPRASLPPLPAVCRRFADLLASDAFLHLRRARGQLRPSLLFLSLPDRGGGGSFSQALLPLQLQPETHPLQVTSLPLPQTLLLQCGSGGGAGLFSHARAVFLPPRAVFLVTGRGANNLRLDAVTGGGFARACARTLFPRKKFAAAAVGGRIYVAGGSARTGAVEEYDPAADAWRVVAECPRRRYGCVGAGAGGVFYVAGGVAVSGSGGGPDGHVCAAGSVDALHVASGAWARPRALPAGGCVIGACGVGEHLYVVAGHAVELSFWRLQGRGGWVALEPPPMPRGAVGIGMAVRVAMAEVGRGTVAAVVSAAAVRGGASASTSAFEGMVLVYDVAGGRWSRAPDLPPGFRRAACTGVEC